jgi:membrane fusion protein (multidrug efflux system)
MQQQETTLQEPKKKNPKMLILIALILIIIATTGCYFWISSKAYETTDNAQIDGNIIPVRSSVTAYLNEIRFQDNQQMKKGDTLMVFNTITLKAKLEQAQAALENAKADLSVSDIRAMASAQNAQSSLQSAQSGQQDITAAKANLDKAKQELERTTSLLKIKAATQEQFETATTAVQVAQANYSQAVSKQASSVSNSLGQETSAKAVKGQISVAQAVVKEKMAELALAEDEFSHAYITSPFDGIVTKRSVSQGQYISSGQALCAIIDNHHLWISANLKETQLDKIKPNQPVQIKVDAFPNLHLTGKVESYLGATGSRFSLLPPDNATGNFIKITQRFPIRISIDGEQSAALYPGLSTFLKIKVQ